MNSRFGLLRRNVFSVVACWSLWMVTDEDGGVSGRVG